jgi:hypothetical protein
MKEADVWNPIPGRITTNVIAYIKSSKELYFNWLIA